MGVDTAALAEAFAAAFDGRTPTHRVHAPGRVNLVGEHLDYNDLPVLPMALQRGITLALRPKDDETVRLVNLDPAYPPVTFEVGVGLEPDGGGAWGDYPKAAARELARRFAVYRGFDAVVASDLPPAAGLSSSSALTNAVGLALCEIGLVGLDPLALAGVMATAERFTGTMGGGMDQAVTLAGRRGHAARIDFRPLRVRHLLVPEDWRFVVADSGVRAEKSGPAQAAYNQRRSECAEVLESLCLVLARDGHVDELPRSYPELLRAVGTTQAVLALGEEYLEGALLKRFRHVVSEAARVEEARDALMVADIMAFGDLMNASHGSLRTDFLVSSGPLDRLVALALEGGAVGARLTGAGFGGCIVALADAGTVDGVVDAIARQPPPPLADVPVERRVFVAEPSDGAVFGVWPA